MIEINRNKKISGHPPVEAVAYKWQDRGANNFHWVDQKKTSTPTRYQPATS